MAPFDEFQSKDLAWISDFVMQQMVIMLRPMMDHIQETDAACDYAQRMVQRVSMDVSEVRGDLDRTNKYLAILRQGLGVQNEGKCMLQRSLETSTRAVKRLDDQVENVLAMMRGTEDSIRQLTTEAQGDEGRHEVLAKQVSANFSKVEELQAQMELLNGETHSLKDSLLSNDAHLEVCQRELRDLRRGQLNIAPKIEDKAARLPPSSQGIDAAPWSQKKAFATTAEPLSASASGATLSVAATLADASGNRSGSRQESKRLTRVGSGTGPGLRGPPVGGLSSASLSASGSVEDSSATPTSRLPFLSSTRPMGSTNRATEAEAGHRLRFSATMANQESRSKQT